jgi:hypothetical protein
MVISYNTMRGSAIAIREIPSVGGNKETATKIIK